MANCKPCKFYRGCETANVGRGLGYCDLDCDQTTCAGEIDLCERPDSLKTYLFAQLKREGGLEWVRRRNVPFSESPKV